MKLNEFKKKQKKQGLYRIFAVCGQMAKSFAMSRQTAKMPRGSYLCNLGGTGLAYVLALPSAGRRQRTLHLCRPPADGIESHVAAIGGTWVGLLGHFAVR